MNSNKKIIAIVSEKGGVGKTTTAINLAGALTKMGKKILLADLNPQQDLSTNLGYVPDGTKTISELIRDKIDTFPIVSDEDKLRLIKHTDFDVDFAPGMRQSLEYLPKIITAKDKACIAEALSDAIFDPYDYIIIDCKDSLIEHLVPQVLASVDYVVPVAECGINSLYDVSEVVKKIGEYSEDNPKLKILGVVLNKLTSRAEVFKEIIEAMEDSHKQLLFETYIPDRKGQTEIAIMQGKPCVFAKSKSGKKNTLADSYIALATEVEQRIARDGEQG